MTPNKPQKSSIETIREKLYREVEQNEKKEYFKAYFLFGFCIAILLVASILFFIAASIESNKPETYTYYFNGEEQKIDISLAFDGKIQYIRRFRMTYPKFHYWDPQCNNAYEAYDPCQRRPSNDIFQRNSRPANET